jgi:hypothetical protein
MFEVMQHCANYLRSRGIFVYMEANNPTPFLVGECAMVYEKLKKQVDYLSDLVSFILRHDKELPESMYEKWREIYEYKYAAKWELLRLRNAYRGRKKAKLESSCKKAWKLANKIDKYL